MFKQKCGVYFGKYTSKIISIYSSWKMYFIGKHLFEDI